MRSSLIYAIALVVVTSALAALSVNSHHRASELPRSTRAAPRASLKYLPEVSSARVLALGQRSAWADLYWIRAVLYFAGELKFGGSFEWLAEHIALVIGLDPDFYDIYRWAGNVTVMRQKRPTFEDIMKANRILDAGIERFRDDWRLPMAAGANCSFWMQPKTAEQREARETCRMKYFDIAAARPDAPDSVVLIASQLHQKSGSTTLACQGMAEAYLTTASKDLKREIEARLNRDVCGALSTEEIRRQAQEFDVAYAPYNYVDPDLAVQLFDPGRYE